MIRLVLCSFFLLPLVSFGQTIVEWNPKYELSLLDFVSKETEINSDLKSYSIASSANMEFGFQMSNYEFMFTKNFNSKVSVNFYQDASVIVAPDSSTALKMVHYGQYHFDLTELYARKFRKELYEQKGAFSSASFFQPIFNKLQQELQAENARVSKLTNVGLERELLAQERQKVLEEIDLLEDYCKSCKPPKRKK